MRILALIIAASSLVGCGSSTTAVDMQQSVGADMEVFSACGHPGDKGNSKHIGQYCDDNNPCPSGTLCSTITNSTLPANQQVYFCTTQCNAAGPDPTCGENAACSCKALGCGCVPDACLPAGMSG